MGKFILFFSVLFLSAQSGWSQELDGWEVYPSFSTIVSLTSDSEVIYAGTLGGVFKVEDNELITVTTMDGLYRSNPRSIVYDVEYERIFAGYIDGTIDIINFQDKNVQRLEDIRRVDRFSSKGINEFKIHAGDLYVATQFGIVVYDLQDLVVEKSFVQIGDFDIGTEINQLDINSDSILVATDQGAGLASLNDNLDQATNWITYNTSNGFNTDQISGVAFFDEGKYAVNEQTVLIFQNGSWEEFEAFPPGEVLNIRTNLTGEILGASTSTSIITLDDQQESVTVSPELESVITDFEILNGELAIGTSNEGLVIANLMSENIQSYLPSGPYLNFFNEMVIDEGNLVATSTSEFPSADILNPIRSYYIYNDGIWENYNRNTASELSTVETVYTVGQNDSSYYLGSWGHGIIKHEKISNNITVYNSSNSNLTGIFADPSYVVISGIESDSRNNVWAVSYNSQDPLYVQLEGSEQWDSFQNVSGSDNYYKLFIDSFDQKWISLITTSNTGLGLLIIDSEYVENPNDDRYIKLTSGSGNGNLPDDKVKTFIQDKRDEVWIGTERGIARFVFPELMIEGGANEREAQWLINEDTTASSRFLLRDVNVSAMAVNDANQKWIGSENQGLWLLNEDGSRIEKRFTSENSNLISDNINSIAIDNSTGEVFIATDLGLVSYQDIPKAPVPEMDKLKVYPNPFQYSRHDQILIEGLSDATRIKIIGVDGFVVNELSAQGGRISWDGYDYNGNQLGSGVYFVIAYEESGRERGLGKVVIVR